MIKKMKKSTKTHKHSKNKIQAQAAEEKNEADTFREINQQSFSNNFMILIQHYKKQLAQNPPKTQVL